MSDSFNFLCSISSFLAIPSSRQTFAECSNLRSARLDLTRLLEVMAPIVPALKIQLHFAIRMLDIDKSMVKVADGQSYLKW